MCGFWLVEDHSRGMHRDPEQSHDDAHHRAAVLPAQVRHPEDETARGKMPVPLGTRGRASSDFGSANILFLIALAFRTPTRSQPFLQARIQMCARETRCDGRRFSVVSTLCPQGLALGNDTQEKVEGDVTFWLVM